MFEFIKALNNFGLLGLFWPDENSIEQYFAAHIVQGCQQYHRSGIEPDVSLISKVYVRDFEELASAFVRFARADLLASDRSRQICSRQTCLRQIARVRFARVA